MEQFQSIVALMPWTSITVLLNLLILTLGLKKFLFKPVQQVFEKRQAQLDAHYDAAKLAEDSANEMRENYEKQLEQAKQEASDIVKSATVRATQRSEEMLNTAKNEVAALKTKAAADIESEQRKAAHALKRDIAGMAVDLAGKVVEKEVDASTHQKLIDEFIGDVGDAS